VTSTNPAELKAQLRRAGLHWLAVHLDDAVARATRERSSPMEFVELLVQSELDERRRRGTERRLREARIGKFKPLADFDWSWPKHIERERVERLMTLDFLAEPANVVLAAPPGLGKTMIAKNLAYHAVLQGHAATFTTAAQLILDLAQQETPRALQARLRRYASQKLLVIDEVGYQAYDTRSADLLFEVVNRRYEHGSIVMTTNLAFSEWPALFPGAACVTALLERLTHHAEILSIEGKSWRHKEAGERQAKSREKRK
jgi:DNA replication protein DnaC